MKTITYLLTFGLLTTFFSCIQPNEKKNMAGVATDTLRTTAINKERARLERRKRIEVQDDEGIKVLNDALIIANKRFREDRFSEKYVIFSDSVFVSVEIKLDYYFTKAIPHLIIRRNDPGRIFFDIYSKGDNEFEKVISNQQGSMTYINDTIRDLNGDGLNDFVLNWYGSAGCCLKSHSTVYLLRQDKKVFSENVEFLNPTFAPREKIIRGVCYGHPGETELYKYKWNGENVDTLEYVYFEKDDKGKKTGKVVISNTNPFEDKSKVLKLLNSVPNEYKKIEGYNWFTGTGY